MGSSNSFYLVVENLRDAATGEYKIAFMVTRVDETTESQSIPLVDAASKHAQGGTQAADGAGASPAACTLDELEQELRAFSQQTKASRTQHRVTPAAAASTVNPPALQCTS